LFVRVAPILKPVGVDVDAKQSGKLIAAGIKRNCASGFGSLSFDCWR
jgi:hypothetical protein